MDLRLSREAVGKILNVSVYAVKEWEEGNASPTVTRMPGVVRFLGYAPFDLQSLSEGEKIRASRRLLGLEREEAARRLGVDVSTLSSWENGKGIKKRAYLPLIEAFINSASVVGRTSG